MKNNLIYEPTLDIVLSVAALRRLGFPIETIKTELHNRYSECMLSDRDGRSIQLVRDVDDIYDVFNF